MARLRLTHLTFLGANVEPATVEFGPQVTLVRGPSDTGKSFIVDSIDFMLGASALKEIPERQGYSTALLGLLLPNDESVTLSRAVTGGNIGLYPGDIRAGSLPVPPETLAAKHNPSSEGNLSMFLLSQIGLEGRRVRKNARNETDSLSFRNIAHLCVVDETQMQSEVSPALTGSYVSKTKEISVLRLLLQDEDDASLIATPAKSDRSRLSGAKLEVVDRLLADLEAQMSDTPDITELRQQLSRLNESIDEQSASIEQLTSARDQLASAHSDSQNEGARTRRRLGDADALHSRFALLLNQYDSDLSRLEMINEAGNLLEYFEPGQCVFCGAEPEHQHLNDECEGESTYFGESVQAEREKTTLLRTDLVATLADLDTQRRDLRQHLVFTQQRASDIRSRLADADQALRPNKSGLNELLQAKTSVEKMLGMYEQVATLEQMKLQIARESDTETAAAVSGLDLAALREFSIEISRRLAAWDFPEASNVRYDRSEQDMVAGDQLRSAHGKGVRAVLHAAFTIGLGQYCFDRDIPHPGFVILDSPLVTYRPPDQAEPQEADVDVLDASVAAAFYRDIQQNFDGQIIVMENTDPPEPLEQETVDIPFTKVDTSGRCGFFPKSSPAQSQLDVEGSDESA
jgi:hypothetical protein